MTGVCYGCKRERDDCETRYDHGARFLCGPCAARPARAFVAQAADLTDEQIQSNRLVDDRTLAAWERDRAASVQARQPDWITRVLGRFEALGLPVFYVGPQLVGSRCPICNAGLGLKFHNGDAVDIVCAAGCEERDIAERIKRAAR